MFRRVSAAVLALLLAAFFAFVGWNKASAPLADLANYHAWTIYIPEALGRAVGWSEMGLAAGLVAGLLPRFQRMSVISALLLILNQCVAAAVHLAQGETSALPQNAFLIALLALLAWLVHRSDPSKKSKETA